MKIRHRSAGAALAAATAVLASLGLATPAQAADTTPPPAPVQTKPALLDGAAARLYVSGRTATDHTRTQLQRVNLSKPSEPAVATSVAATAVAIPIGNLTVGSTYRFTLRAQDSSGNLSGPTVIRLTATNRATQLGYRTGEFYLFPPVDTLQVGVQGAGNASSTRYTARYRLLPGASQPWLTNVPAGTYVFGSPAAPGQLATGRVPGTYSFEIVARDGFGNATGTSTSYDYLIPFDAANATTRGNVTEEPRQVALHGTMTVLHGTASSITFRQQGDFFRVFGQICNGCGAYRVFINGKDAGGGSSAPEIGEFAYEHLSGHRMNPNQVNIITIRPVSDAPVVIDNLMLRFRPPPWLAS